ncbi:MAG: response regulator transcription factor [Gammaproteobacteria bacterium]|nr:response regulator transcription factor [Gammaproteobacteria bacterium]
MDKKITVLLVDDHAVVRSGLRRLLEQGDEVDVVAEAESGEQAYQLYGEILPEILVMDMSMPGIGGLEALRRIKLRYSKAKIIIFSMYENATFSTQALTAGALGYVSKSGEAGDLLTAVKQVYAGKIYLSSEMAQKIALHTMSGDDNPIQKLTAREFEIFRLLAEGKVVDEIAKLLNIGQKTVANYQTLLKQKLHINSPVELVRLAIRHGVIED